jgi:hypothetical protein
LLGSYLQAAGLTGHHFQGLIFHDFSGVRSLWPIAMVKETEIATEYFQDWYPGCFSEIIYYKPG